MSRSVFVVLPVTLFEELPPSNTHKIVLAEHPVYFGKFRHETYRFSKPKLCYTKATCLAYCAYLKEHNVPFDYVTVDTYDKWSKTLQDVELTCYDPVDYDCLDSLSKKCKTLHVLESPNYLVTSTNLQQYVTSTVRKGKQKYMHKHFYEYFRKQAGLLMKDGKPIGGRYSFDSENREPLPKNYPVPGIPQLSQTDLSFHRQAEQWVDKIFPHAPGSWRGRIKFPVTHATSKQWLTGFIVERIEMFGKYEDAISQDNPLLHHSGVSPMLLTGLLTGKQVLEVVLAAGNTVPLNSLEGFVRQLYWREYVRMLYVYDYDDMWAGNSLGNKRRLTDVWYTGTTGILPVDEAIRDAFSDGYLHHIRRLMIVGNFMVLCEIHPHDILKWFLEFAVDSNFMIMMFNCLEMVGFASGGRYTTKPYVSAANYVLKMSDYQPGSWTQIWTALYYNFWNKQGTGLKGIRQAQFALGNFERKSKVEKNKLLVTAKQYIRKVTS